MEEYYPRCKASLRILLGAILYIQISHAIANTLAPYPIRFSAQAGAGDQTQGFLEVLFPAWGNETGFAFAGISGQYGSDSSWYGSIGIGGRQVIQDYLLGAYLFADHDTTVDIVNNNWWVANPGIEIIGVQWDSRINAYLPVSEQQQTTIEPIPVSDVPPFELSGFQAHFQGRAQYTQDFFRLVKEAIPRGADIDIGYTTSSSQPWRIHGGAYHYQYSEDQFQNMTGIQFGISTPLSRNLSFQVDLSYDNVNRNSAIVSLRFNAGGTTSENTKEEIEEHLTDPIRRHFGTLYTSSATPVQGEQEYGARLNESMIIEFDNIWFFTGNNSVLTMDQPITQESCTYENPCSAAQFNQATLDQIALLAPNANLYLGSGHYSALTSDVTPAPLLIREGQHLYGRSTDFLQWPGLEYVYFDGALILQTNTSLVNLFVLNVAGSQQTTGIILSGAQNVYLHGVTIGSIDATHVEQTYLNAIQLTGSSSLTLIDTTVQAFSSASDMSVGIRIVGDNNWMTILGGVINAYGENSAATGVWINGRGLANDVLGHANHNTVSIYNGNVYANSTNGDSRGIWIDGHGASDNGTEGNNGANYNSVILNKGTLSSISTVGLSVGIMVDGNAATDGGGVGVGGGNGANNNTIVVEKDALVTVHGVVAQGIFLDGSAATLVGTGANNGANANTVRVNSGRLELTSTFGSGYALFHAANSGIAMGNSYTIQNNSIITVVASDIAYGIFDSYDWGGGSNTWEITIPPESFHFTGSLQCQESHGGAPC